MDQAPLDDMRRALAAQDTRDFRHQAQRMARAKARAMRNVGRPLSGPDELVNDVLADTWLGTLTWDPTTTTLLDHLCETLKLRTRRDAKRIRRFPHVAIDIAEDHDADGNNGSIAAEVEPVVANARDLDGRHTDPALADTQAIVALEPRG